MKSCSSCGHQCANGAGYCCNCLIRFSGREPYTPDAGERIGPMLASGFILFVSFAIVGVAWWMVATSNFWDVIAHVWWSAVK